MQSRLPSPSKRVFNLDTNSEPTFVSEPIEPDVTSMDASRLARGEPAPPHAFAWRGQQYEVALLLRTWRTYKLDRGDRYVDRHWFDVRLRSGQTARLYCLRRVRSSARWFIFSIT
jgi:hypothetical protein